MSEKDRFWQASVEELKQGFTLHQRHYHCLLCGFETEQGMIYPEHGRFCDAERAMRNHLQETHQSVFHYLLGLDKKLTGITDHQRNLLGLFYEGKSDAEIQQELAIGSASTIRNHRFVLKEKERQSRLFLVLMELLKDRDQHAPAIVDVHKTARMIDERYHITHDEYAEVVKKYFPQGSDGPLSKFPLKQKYKLMVLMELVKRFSPHVVYTEKEVNGVLEEAYDDDYVTLRRYLIDYGFLDRKPDGSQYWIKIKGDESYGTQKTISEAISGDQD